MACKSLEEVIDYLDSIPAINSGGCGISALAMFRWLKKYKLLKNTKFVYIHYSQDGYDDNCQAMRNGSRLFAPPHCVLEHDGILIDSGGELDFLEFREYTLTIKDERIIVVSINSGDWNEGFDRNEWVPKIEKRLDIDLSDIEV